MSLFGVMRTGVSGMNAQGTRMSTVADNIANANTTGYKRGSTEFESVVEQVGTDLYTAGGVQTHIRYGVSEQGALMRTNEATNLAISGNGFFVVNDAAGRPFLTRAGAFVPDSEGRLVNAGGFYLMGYNTATGSSGVANGLTGLETVRIDTGGLQANPSTQGRLAVNLPADATAVAAGQLPSLNGADAAFTAKSSLVAYDDLGREVILDVYMTKTADETWQIAVFNRADAATGGGFPYGSGPLTTGTLEFDPTTGKLAGGSATSFTVTVPGGRAVTVDLSKTTQLAADYALVDAGVNGNAPSPYDRIEISDDGIVSTIYKDGTRIESYRIPLADVNSPNNLTLLAGNVYSANESSGDVRVGTAQQARLGTIYSAALEDSTVDMATELTTMIEAQRGFAANSKVFQAGSDLLEILMSLKG